MQLRLPQTQIQPFNVLAFDPGGTTGWAQAILPAHMIVTTELVRLDDIELRTGEWGPEPHHRWVYNLIGDMYHEADDGNVPIIEVVSEPFHYRQNVVEEGQHFRGKVELISAEYIGVMRLACAQLGLTYYDRFTPGEAKTYVTNKKLSLLGWLQEPQYPMRHQNDALRQLVKYLIAKKKIQHPITSAWRVQ
jgi:hypothetical protein